MSDTQLIKSRRHRVFIEDLNISAVIGVYDWERTINQTLLISVSIDHDFSSAAQSDAIQDALDYNQVCQKITELCHQTKANLLEHLIDLLGQMILREFEATRVEISIKKPTAVAAASSVGVSAEFLSLIEP